MGWGLRRFFCLFFCLQALLFIQRAPSADATVGVVYGEEGDNLPLPSQVVQLLTTNFVTNVRLYGADASTLKAFVGSNLQVIVGVLNTELATVGASNQSAALWVTTNIVPFATSVNITTIAVGNEVLTTEPGFSGVQLHNTMVWIHNALIVNGLDTRVRVSTPFTTDYLSNSFPPSQSVFNATFLPTITSILQFINFTGSYLMLNVNTFKVFQQNPAALTLGYALFEPAEPVTDAYNKLAYYNLFDALVDSTYAALGTIGFASMNLVVSETGWPSQGDANEVGANTTNAQTYNSNLVDHVNNKSAQGTPQGTPLRPLTPITAYVYELFNEDLQTGPTSNRYYGLFQHNLTPVYNVDLTGQGRLLTSNGTEYQTWCVASSAATAPALQNGINWACSTGGVNCTATQLGGPCYLPNTVPNHASWIFNAYYQQVANAPNSCSFNDAAEIVSYNPSYVGCTFQASNVTTTVAGSPIPPTSPNSARALQFQSGVWGACMMVIFILTLRYLH